MGPRGCGKKGSRWRAVCVLDEHPHLTLTGLCNVLETLRVGERTEALALADRRIFDDGLVMILRELHDRLDRVVVAAITRLGYAATSDGGRSFTLRRAA